MSRCKFNNVWTRSSHLAHTWLKHLENNLHLVQKKLKLVTLGNKSRGSHETSEKHKAAMKLHLQMPLRHSNTASLWETLNGLKRS